MANDVVTVSGYLKVTASASNLRGKKLGSNN